MGGGGRDGIWARGTVHVDSVRPSHLPCSERQVKKARQGTGRLGLRAHDMYLHVQYLKVIYLKVIYPHYGQGQDRGHERGLALVSTSYGTTTTHSLPHLTSTCTVHLYVPYSRDSSRLPYRTLTLLVRFRKVAKAPRYESSYNYLDPKVTTVKYGNR